MTRNTNKYVQLLFLGKNTAFCVGEFRILYLVLLDLIVARRAVSGKKKWKPTWEGEMNISVIRIL